MSHSDDGHRAGRLEESRRLAGQNRASHGGRETEVWRLYEGAAAAFDRDRQSLIGEQAYLLEAIVRIGRARPHVLDLGCGTGHPIATLLAESNCLVTGVDAAPRMLSRARERLPEMTWIERDMRRLDLGRRFDLIVAWDSFFHLTADDQRAMFPVFQAHAAAGGQLLFTSGPAAGEAWGKLYGRDLHHASLDAEEYRQLLARHGFEVVRHRVEDPDCGGHTVWLAQSGTSALSAGAPAR